MTVRKAHTPYQRALVFFLLILPMICASLAPAPVNAQSAQLPVYVVQSGDTLYGIAGQFFTTIDEILAVNNRSIGDTLRPGDRLFIPGFEGLQGVLTTDYVPLGASLRSLSRRTQSEPASLVRLNKFTSQSELFVGRKIALTTSETTQNLQTMPSLLPGQSWMERSILSGQNPLGSGAPEPAHFAKHRPTAGRLLRAFRAKQSQQPGHTRSHLYGD